MVSAGGIEGQLCKAIDLSSKMIHAVSWKELLRLLSVMDKLERCHPKERHYYLQFIVVVSKYHGKSAGMALMMPTLHICDREKCWAYLENSKEDNLAFYGRFGFIVNRFLIGQSPR
ncbi:MAG: hypothetical protein CVU62_02215 [Deltaproteobacteria bacterium HGW-Deltaproteobacteria-2]|jgi:predicted GNAT family N-acyltransferase|nr:MAG: hypothetical protein CVU62_02215 [Deltaproteobacteria bacterium HGW-Deltaproteobacteria-2]